MTKKLLYLLYTLLLVLAMPLHATDYTVNFTGSGASTTVENVIVENLTQGTIVTVPAGAALILTNSTAVNQVSATDESLRIYPNPMQGEATVSYYSAYGGNTQLQVNSLDGKKLFSNSMNLNAGLNQFKLSLPSGAYIIQINESGKVHNARVINQHGGTKAELTLIGNNNTAKQRSKTATVSFAYNTGDLLLFKGYSGNYTTYVTGIITSDQTIHFNFVECKDADGNYYPTVTIGTQTWMAENLKTTHYRNGVAIPNHTTDNAWNGLMNDAFSGYINTSDSIAYGKLYNWYAAMSSNYLAPNRWHIPSDSEWKTLLDYLGGASIAGGKLKETGTTYWTGSNNASSNSSGFSGRPGGLRPGSNIVNTSYCCYWWTSNEGPYDTSGNYYYTGNNNANITQTYTSKVAGLSVRCVLDNTGPKSIYEQLKNGYTEAGGTTHTFATYIRLIDDVGRTEQLKDPANLTLFACDDAAFARFFQSNAWGVSSYESLTPLQKRTLISSSLLYRTFSTDQLANSDGTQDGAVIRRNTFLNPTDLVTTEAPSALPSNSYWDAFRTNGLLLVKDNTNPPMVFFTQKNMEKGGISNEDFSILFNGKTRINNDVYIFGNKVVVKDIQCQNGNINLMEEVQIPPANMAEIIRTVPETQQFSHLLERFAAPYPDPVTTNNYKLLYPDFKDSIRVKRYFSASTVPTYLGWDLLCPATVSSGYGTLMIAKDPMANYISNAAILDFDPGWNAYITTSTTSTNSPYQTDMGAMFVPTNEALNAYFSTGGGRFLVEKYGAIENIPNDISSILIRNAMKPSFLGSVPGKFGSLLNDAQLPMCLDKSNVVKSYVGNNGVVYVVNKVFAAASWSTVTAPVSVNNNLKVFNWAINNCPSQTSNYTYYLLSMNARYSLVVPSDKSVPPTGAVSPGLYYLNPTTLSKAVPEMWKFWYDEKSRVVNATKYSYDFTTGMVGDSIGIEKGSTSPTIAQPLVSCLTDMMNYHIIAGNIEDGKEFYRTKGNGEIKISGSVEGTMQISGGGNIERACPTTVNKIYDQSKETNTIGNGKTYLVNSPLLPSYRSVYKLLEDDRLSSNPRYSKFFSLLQDGDAYDEIYLIAHKLNPTTYKMRYNVFVQTGIDYNVKFFNTFHYTVYLPTNEAMDAAFAQGLPTWDAIKAIPDAQMAHRDSLADKLITFIRYHFQDNSVYIDGQTTETNAYTTAAYSMGTTKIYYKLYTQLTPSGLTVASTFDGLTASTAAHVVTTTGQQNSMVREYVFSKSYPGTIETSSYAVIQPVDKVLLYSPTQLNDFK